MAIDADTVESYFAQLDWPFVRRDEHNWVTRYQGDAQAITLQVRTTDSWLYVYVPFEVKVQPVVRARFQDHLLRLNHRINLAKFMLDDDGDVGLTVELPCTDLRLGQFEDALRACCVYADEHFAELAKLAAGGE
jgi:hypothetical protein